jgi:DNA polymerase III delta prime subunit
MHAFLLLTDHRLQSIEIKEQINLIAKNYRVVEFEVQKVADLRPLREFGKLKQSEKIFIYVSNFGNATHETQNAMLKLLEEPQENLSYILEADREELILPTVLSRCEVIRVRGKEDKSDESDLDKYFEFIDLSYTKQMIYIKDIKGRDEAKEFLINLIMAQRERMREGKFRAKKLELALETLRNIERNGNPQIQLTGMVLGM